MKIILSGASGLVGIALKSTLNDAGYVVQCLVRGEDKQDNTIFWDPYSGKIDLDAIEGSDAVIHLSGANLATIWTEKNKKLFRSSRIDTTAYLCNCLTKLSQPPKALISASAIGYYGDRSDEVVTEESAPGSGFISELCRDWEAATNEATKIGIRVVNIRIGIVLSRTGGALAKMLTPFKLGSGGAFGNGQQYMSWITLTDLVNSIHHILIKEELSGPVNLVSPNPVTNKLFTKTLGRVLRRPTVMTIPAFVLRTTLGEMAEEMLLSGQRVHPQKLVESGYPFSHPQLKEAFNAVLGKK